MANIDTELGDIPVSGNFGVRMVDTNQSSTVLQDVQGDPEQGAQYITDDASSVMYCAPCSGSPCTSCNTVED